MNAQSVEQNADAITAINYLIPTIDWKSLRKSAEDMIALHHHNEARMILNMRFNKASNDLLLVQGKALSALITYKELLQECDNLKAIAAKEDELAEQINKLFGL